MKWKFLSRVLTLSSISVILYGCPPDLEINPEKVTKIINEGGSNYCYVSVKNTSSTDWCDLALESPTKYLLLVSVTPTIPRTGYSHYKR